MHIGIKHVFCVLAFASEGGVENRGTQQMLMQEKKKHFRSLLFHKYNENIANVSLISGTILFWFFTALSFQGQTVYKTARVSFADMAENCFERKYTSRPLGRDRKN